MPFSELGCSQYKQAQCILGMQLLIEMKLCRKLLVKLPCTLVIITGSFEVSVDVYVCLCPRFTPINTFQVQEEVLPQTLQSTIKAGVSQLTALRRARIRESAGGYSQLLVCCKATHLVQQVLRGEAHTCSSVSSVA